MSNYKEGLDSILQAINNLITPQLVSLKYDKTFRGKITNVIDNGLYEVQVSGRSYTLPYAGTLQVGDIVKVKSPLNNFSDIYIEAIGGSGGSGTTTNYNDLTNKPILNTNYTSSLSPDASEIIKGTIGLHKISKTGKYSDLIGIPDLDFIPNSEKGVAGGVATLDENSKLPTSQLPDGIITDPNYVHTDNNFTNALLTKLNGIESGAQVNKIESISKNGEVLTITNKNVDIEVPTKLSELENDNNTVTDKDYVHTDNNFTNALLTKLNGIESGAEVNAISGIKVNEVLQPIVNKIVSITIPTKTSDLTNDSGFINKDVDNLTNYYKKTETYSQSETNTLLDNKADKSSIPTKLSQLDNDTGFVTNAVDNLTNYYLKSETYTKTEVNDLIGQIKTISIQVVDTLPTTGESNIIYLVPKEGSKDDVYNEYIWVNNAWELIGSTQIDLTGYATEDWVNTQIANFLTESQITQLINNSLANYYTQEQVNNLLDNKADKSSIPTKTSDLTNDSGYITKSVDNLDNYYTETEINSLLGNKANTSDIPTKTSQLTNDSGYIDNTVNDLENYYKKSETYNQTQVNNLLNNKADKTEIPTKVSELENDKGYISEIPIASATQLGGIKVGDNLVITKDGVLSSIGGSTGTSDYNALSNKPALNTDNSAALEVNAQEEISGTVSLHKVSKTGNYNDLLNKPNIPSKTSDLTNDSGFITNEVDNLTNYYTETEVNNLLSSKADTSQIPTKVSELDNDTGFITNSTNELTNYYKKTETYNQTEVNNLLANKANTSDVPTKTSQLTNDGSDGTNPFISEIPIASGTQLGGIKVGNNLSIEADGTLNASEGGVKSYNDLTDKPILNTNVSTSQPVSEGETITGEIVLHKISKTGSYNDLLDKPTIPEPSNEVEISQTQPTDTGVELWVDLSENPSGGGQKTHKYKMSGSPMKEVLPGGKLTLPCTYKVGAGVLDIYFNGELLILSADAAGSNGHYLEVGTTGSISNEIQLTNDWGTSADYYLAIVVRGEYGNPNITFKVGATQYQAEKGMTFNEYTSSSYNVDGFYVYGADHYVYTGDGKTFYPPSGTSLVVGSDTIISGGNYTLNEG